MSAFFTKIKSYILSFWSLVEKNVAQVASNVDHFFETVSKLIKTTLNKIHEFFETGLSSIILHAFSPGKLLVAAVLLCLAIDFVSMGKFKFVKFLTSAVTEIWGSLAGLSNGGLWAIIVIVAVYFITKNKK